MKVISPSWSVKKLSNNLFQACYDNFPMMDYALVLPHDGNIVEKKVYGHNYLMHTPIGTVIPPIIWFFARATDILGTEKDLLTSH